MSFGSLSNIMRKIKNETRIEPTMDLGLDMDFIFF